MLHIPDQYKDFKMISIDPGSALMGVAVMDINYSSRHINSVTATTWDIDKLDNVDNIQDTELSSMNIKLYKIRREFGILLKEVNPLLVVFEKPFFYTFKPGAYAPLIKVLESIQIQTIQHNPSIVIDYLEPKLVKKIVGASLSSDKSTVAKALSIKPDLQHLDIDNYIKDLGKDAVDAIAIGYAYVKNRLV